jgi:hypothetical protein
MLVTEQPEPDNEIIPQSIILLYAKTLALKLMRNKIIVMTNVNKTKYMHVRYIGKYFVIYYKLTLSGKILRDLP